jgi:hypothetical protein
MEINPRWEANNTCFSKTLQNSGDIKMIPLKYAGIGSRTTPPNILHTMTRIAILLAHTGIECSTGAAIGADQAFGNGAIAGGGKLHIALPWDNYELAWQNSLKGQVTKTVLNPEFHVEAMQSVKEFHPKWKDISQGAYKLHARNFLIIQGCAFIICWTPNGAVKGGTGQAIRIAEKTGINVWNLGDKKTLDYFLADIEKRINEIPEGF